MIREKKSSVKKKVSLQRRWLSSTVAVVFLLGLVCVTILTGAYAVNHYRSTQSDMETRAESISAFLNAQQEMELDDFCLLCSNYASAFNSEYGVVLQFLDNRGKPVSASDAQWMQSPSSPEIGKAVSNRSISHFVGRDGDSGQWVMAVSCPVIYSNGEVVGVFRFVTPTAKMNLRILVVGLCSLAVLAMVIVLFVLASRRYIRSLLRSLHLIAEKANKIASGSYGIQIKTEYNDEIGELAKTINEMSSQIARNEKMQAEFISSLSHELRTPLTAITGWSETLLGDETLDADSQRGVRIIYKEAKRLTEMVVDLLDFTRIQDGKMTLNMSTSDIRAEFEDTVFMYSSRLEQDGIILDYLDNDEDVPEITCDPERLRQVFLNILDNAAKHGREGKRIEASIHHVGANVEVRIRDFGPGIPEDEIPLVKRKFYKGSSKARGSGIGLAVSDEIVQMHGGELILSNAAGGGTLVTVLLPTAQ